MHIGLVERLEEMKYCRMLNIGEHLSWRIGYVWRSQFLNFASVTSGVLFLYASIIFGDFYFGERNFVKQAQQYSKWFRYESYCTKIASTKQ